MNPEKQERLNACQQELAALLYEQTNKSELTDLESIEKTVSQQMLELVNPNIALFYRTSNTNQNWFCPKSEKLRRGTQAQDQTGAEIGVEAT